MVDYSTRKQKISHLMKKKSIFEIRIVATLTAIMISLMRDNDFSATFMNFTQH